MWAPIQMFLSVLLNTITQATDCIQWKGKTSAHGALVSLFYLAVYWDTYLHVLYVVGGTYCSFVKYTYFFQQYFVMCNDYVMYSIRLTLCLSLV